MPYEDPGCAYCPDTIRVCHHADPADNENRRPDYCPTKVDPEAAALAREAYADPFTREVARASTLVTTEGSKKWSRVEDICAFARKMGFRKIGIATCISFVDHARILSAILESHGFEVASAACMNGSVPKEEIGISDDEKLEPGRFETMCNTIGQAMLLNRAGCQLNVALGLCVGHDSLLFKHSEGLVTVLVAKDKMLAHNPLGALSWAHSYYNHVWGPDRPEKLPRRPRK